MSAERKIAMEKTNEQRRNRNLHLCRRLVKEIAQKTRNKNPEYAFEDTCNVAGMICAELLFSIDNTEIAEAVSEVFIRHIENGLLQHGVNFPKSNGSIN
jgi:DNA-directed RNA polymerase specialized sigma subunit